MSSRNIRKFCGTNTLPPCDSSDEEYTPLYVRNYTESKFKGLVLSSDSSESEPAEPEPIDVEDTEVKGKIFKKATKNKKKSHKGKNNHFKTNFEGMDEIDKSLKEVNDMLGEPPIPTPKQEKPVNPRIALMKVSTKHLNYENELWRLFGPIDNEEKKRHKKIRTQLTKATIVPLPENAMRFPCKGLSMSLQFTSKNCNYFSFSHSVEYQKKYRAILTRLMQRFESMPNMNEEEMETNNLTIEGMLENVDTLLQHEEYIAANKMIEKSILIMQALAHSSFNLLDMRTRLEYKYLENRVFHVAVLKYLHLLTNKACHRTALELAKLLLNLDPSDPLALLFIIDTLALRAREHRWLIDIVDCWSTERNARFLFNIQYSYAMSHFHVATKNKEDLTKADNLIQEAMLAYPLVMVKILEFTSSPNPNIQSHELFTIFAELSMVRDLRALITIYAKFTWSRWREGPVMNWLTRNALELIEKFNNDPEVKEHALDLAELRVTLFRSYSVEVIRHLSIIKPMSDLLLDGEMPNFMRTISANPAPEVSDGIDRYNYYRLIERPIVNSATMLLASFIASMMPEHPQGLDDLELIENMNNFRIYVPRDEDVRAEDNDSEMPVGDVGAIDAEYSAGRAAGDEAATAGRRANDDTDDGAKDDEDKSDDNITDRGANVENATAGFHPYVDSSSDEDSGLRSLRVSVRHLRASQLRHLLMRDFVNPDAGPQ